MRSGGGLTWYNDVLVKGLKRNVRSLQGSVQHDSVETADVQEIEAVEDIVVMDYAQPHRKPPIHNEKP